MAGLGRKVWQNETLGQPDLQGYLQDQVVMVFADAAARDAAIPAGSRTEGMAAHLLSTHVTSQYVDGGWVPLVGQWAQVVSPNTYNWAIPAGGVMVTMAALAGGADATLSVAVPLGRQLDVEFTVPYLGIGNAASVFLRLLGSLSAVPLDVAVFSTSSGVAMSSNMKLTGVLPGQGVATPVTVKPQAYAAAAGSSVQAHAALDARVRWRYRII